MTKQELLDQLTGSTVAEFAFIPVSKVIELVNQLEEEKASVEVDDDKLNDFLADLESELDSFICRQDAEEVVDYSSAEFELNGNEVSLYSIDLNGGSLSSDIFDFVEKRVKEFLGK